MIRETFELVFRLALANIKILALLSIYGFVMIIAKFIALCVIK